MLKKKPLDGIKVIELGALVAGPFASRLLAEFGADIIKVESLQGDKLRQWGLHAPGQDTYWSMVQTRNKRSISIDMKTFEGQEIVKKLIKEADVVLENFEPGTLAKWHLSHEELREINPHLIVTSISGFGQTGPYRSEPGFGNVAESMGGMRYVTGYTDRPPVPLGLSIGDSIAGLYAVIGTLLSLYHRDVQSQHIEKKGQIVDVALYEAVFSLLEGMVPEYVHEGVVRERSGDQHGLFNAGSIPAGPIYNIEDILKDPHYQARDMLISISDDRIGDVVMPGIVPKLSETPGEIKWAGPNCGAHTEEVLLTLGYTEEEVQELIDKNVIKIVSKSKSKN